jgi:polyisoprenoid-binding protein YceI
MRPQSLVGSRPVAPQRLAAISFLLLLGAGALSAAGPLRLEIDPSVSEVSFVLGGNVHTVHGGLRITSGSVLFDPGDGSLSGQVVADASSATAENPKVVKRMHKEVLEVAEFPAIVFRPERIELPFDNDTRTHLVGTFDIHGTSHTLTLPVDVIMEADLVTATVTLDIPYVAWGMKDPSRLMFRSAKEVQVGIKLVGRVTPYGEETDER